MRARKAESAHQPPRLVALCREAGRTLREADANAGRLDEPLSDGAVKRRSLVRGAWLEAR